jgi:hypothetical protein
MAPLPMAFIALMHDVSAMLVGYSQKEALE